MNIQQANILLEKINALHKSMSLDGVASSIELDLMLSYVRQYYEALLDGSPSASATRKRSVGAAPKVAPTPKPTPPPAPEPVPAPAPKPEPVVEAPKPKPAPPPKVEVAPPPAPKPAPAPPAPNARPAVTALFPTEQPKALPEKLGQAAITDLTKAMSINDKLLYANELFGRDMSAMNTMLQKLNGLGSFDSAKVELIQLAERNDWTNEERREIAQSFIKLVQRRF